MSRAPMPRRPLVFPSSSSPAQGSPGTPSTVRAMPEFTLQFELDQVRTLAARYRYDDDREVLAIGRHARDRGHYSRDELITVCRWKTPRSGPLVRANSAVAVEAQTRIALAGASSERQR